MRKVHVCMALLIFFVTLITSYVFKLPITNYTAQNLITAFAIFFGFYLTTISTLFGSKYMSRLKSLNVITTKYTDDVVVYKYFLISGSWSIFSIASILILSFMSKLNSYSELVVLDNSDLTVLISSLVISISSVNILFVLIIFRMLLGGLLHENYEDA